MIRFTAGAASDVGRVRSLNEDSMAVGEHLVAVADGMGGHRGGEVASALAVETFASEAADATLERMMRAVQAANSKVFDMSHGSPELAGMGTTLCGLGGLDDGHVGVVNVGDSRVYLLRRDEYVQVSDDHSFVESLVRDGRLTRAQADVHPQRNVLTRALGIERHVDVDGWEVAVEVGDRFLLCSDGLFNEVPEPDQERILRGTADPSAAALALVALANEAGGRDNVTCVVVDIVDVPAGAAPASVASGLVKRSTAADLDETSLDDATLGSAGTPGSAPTDGGAGGVGGVGGGSPMPASAPASKDSATPGGSRFGWRTALFVLAIIATLGAALGAVGWYARNTYFVGSEDGEVVIFQGPPNGILWIEPEVIPQNILVSTLADESQVKALERGVEQGSRAEARRYVANLRLITDTGPADAAPAPIAAPSSTAAVAPGGAPVPGETTTSTALAGP